MGFIDTTFSEGPEPACLEVKGSEMKLYECTCELLFLGVHVIHVLPIQHAVMEQFMRGGAG